MVNNVLNWGMATTKRNKLTAAQKEWLEEQERAKQELLQAQKLNEEIKPIDFEALRQDWLEMLERFAMSEIRTFGDRFQLSKDTELEEGIRKFGKKYWSAEFAERIKFVTKFRIGIRNVLSSMNMLGFPR